MNEIKLTLDRYWLNKKEYLLSRIANIIDGSDEAIKQDQGYQYRLGDSNDWKASFDGKTVTIAGRYASEEKMAALKAFLIQWMGLQA